MQIFRQSSPDRENTKCKDPEGVTLMTRYTETPQLKTHLKNWLKYSKHPFKSMPGPPWNYGKALGWTSVMCSENGQHICGTGPSKREDQLEGNELRLVGNNQLLWALEAVVRRLDSFQTYWELSGASKQQGEVLLLTF